LQRERAQIDALVRAAFCLRGIERKTQRKAATSVARFAEKDALNRLAESCRFIGQKPYVVRPLAAAFEQRHIAVEDQEACRGVVAQLGDEGVVGAFLGAPVERIEVETDGSG